MTVVELAAFLGITPSGLRNVIQRHSIKPVGRRWKAHLYDVADVLRHTGSHDRLAA